MIRTKEVEAEGKTFVVHQMPLLQGDRWANRVILALCKSGIDVSSLPSGDGFKGMMDMVGVVNIAIKALGGIEEENAQRLLDELLSTIKLKLPDGSMRNIILDTDITSIDTLWKLRIEAIKINLDFLTAGVTQ